MDQPGDDRFVQRLVQHQAQLFAFVHLLLPSHADAEEVYQETCLVLWRSRDTYDPSREFMPWCRGVARNQVRKFRRQHQSKRVMLSEEMMDELASAAEQRGRRQQEVNQVLADCLAQLEARQQQLLQRCYSGAESIKQVAAGLGENAEALYMRLHRLRRALADCVDRNLNQSEPPQ